MPEGDTYTSAPLTILKRFPRSTEELTQKKELKEGGFQLTFRDSISPISIPLGYCSHP